MTQPYNKLLLSVCPEDIAHHIETSPVPLALDGKFIQDYTRHWMRTEAHASMDVAMDTFTEVTQVDTLTEYSSPKEFKLLLDTLANSGSYPNIKALLLECERIGYDFEV